MGRRGDGDYGARCRVFCFAADHASQMVVGVAIGSWDCRRDCGSGGRDQGASREFAAFFGTRAKVSLEFRARDRGRWIVNVRAGSRGIIRGTAGNLVAVVRHVDRDGRSIFRSRGAGDGAVFDDSWHDGGVRAPTMGRCADGEWIRWSANRTWRMDRAPVRRIAGVYGKKLDSKTRTIEAGEIRAAGCSARERPRSGVAGPGPVDSRTHPARDRERGGGKSFAYLQRAEKLAKDDGRES